MTAVNAGTSRALIGALVRSGVRHAVVSPGSRNTPIVLALMEEEPELDVHVVIDERVAAFRALGIARVTQSPVILSCTSGTAGAHWLPAVVEANLSGIPLIAITADRPAELHGAGAPQTIDQSQLFAGQVRLAVDLSEPSANADAAWLGGTAARILDAAAGVHPGPVHVNAPFRKPLWEPGAATTAPRLARIHRPRPAPDVRLQDLWAPDVHGAIVVGPVDAAVRSAHFGRAMAELAVALGWPLIAEPASGVRSGDRSENAVWNADAILRDADVAAAMKPEVVLRFGPDATNKAVYRWAASAGRTLVVDPFGRWQDPHHVVDVVLAGDPTALARHLADQVSTPAPETPWLSAWRRAEALATAAIAPHVDTNWWEGAAMRAVFESIPAGGALHLASSMPIRNADTWGGHLDTEVLVTSNRGANGIDGLIATASGQARARAGHNAVVLGDLAFRHDVGGLLALAEHRDPLVVVVFDNDGGAIFERLPIRDHDLAFERFFRTPRHTPIPDIARGMGLPATTVSNTVDLIRVLREALRSASPHVVHVALDPRQDEIRRESAFEAVREALARWSAPL